MNILFLPMSEIALYEPDSELKKAIDTIPDELTIEYVKPEPAMPHAGAPVSPEAMARAKVLDTFMYDTRTKTAKPVIGVEAVDIPPSPFEVKISRHKQTGKLQVLDIGEKASFKPEMVETLQIQLTEKLDGKTPLYYPKKDITALVLPEESWTWKNLK